MGVPLSLGRALLVQFGLRLTLIEPARCELMHRTELCPSGSHMPPLPNSQLPLPHLQPLLVSHGSPQTAQSPCPGLLHSLLLTLSCFYLGFFVGKENYSHIFCSNSRSLQAPLEMWNREPSLLQVSGHMAWRLSLSEPES